MDIQEHVKEFIVNGGRAEVVNRDGVDGVLFFDEVEFIPFTDLNYNNEYGYYKISLFPDIQRDCTNPQ